MACYPNGSPNLVNPYTYGYCLSRHTATKLDSMPGLQNRFLGENFYEGASTPVGYPPQGALVMSQKYASLGTTPADCVTSDNAITAQLWATRQLAATLVNANTVTANAALIVALAANILSANTTSGSVNMTLALAANLASQGNIAAALSAIAFCVSEMTSDGNLSASNLRGTARFEASLTTEGTVTTARACAEAVWTALAASFNTTGTMGAKLNAAGSASNPWTDPTGAQVAAFVERIKALIEADEIHTSTTVEKREAGTATVLLTKTHTGTPLVDLEVVE